LPGKYILRADKIHAFAGGKTLKELKSIQTISWIAQREDRHCLSCYFHKSQTMFSWSVAQTKFARIVER
jgi:hypothetical protein